APSAVRLRFKAHEIDHVLMGWYGGLRLERHLGLLLPQLPDQYSPVAVFEERRVKMAPPHLHDPLSNFQHPILQVEPCNLGEVLSGVPDLLRISEGEANHAGAHCLNDEGTLSSGKYDPPHADHLPIADRISDDCKRLLAHVVPRGDVVRRIKIA